MKKNTCIHRYEQIKVNIANTSHEKVATSTHTYIVVFMRRFHDDLSDRLGVARMGEHIDVTAEVVFLRPVRVGAFRTLHIHTFI